MLTKEYQARPLDPGSAQRESVANELLQRSGEELLALVQHHQDENPCIKRVTRIRRTGPVTTDLVDRLPAPGDCLAEHLSHQLRMGSNDPRLIPLATWIIWNLDSDGYLREDLVELAAMAGADVAELEQALAVV